MVRLASGVLECVVAILALLGLLVVVVLLQEEVLPRFLSWWEDVQEGRAHYQAVRLERGIKEEAIDAAVRTQATLDLGRQRMTAALERSRPPSNPGSLMEAVSGPTSKPRPPV